MPSVVTGMLHTLDVHEGQTVLEIGTGTGFNAALLAELVGARGRVCTVEVDPELHADAADRLAGYLQVSCVLGDGTRTADLPGTFDRIICTAAVHLGRIPYDWVTLTRTGGLSSTKSAGKSDVASM